MRKLATIRKIDALRPIPDADAIETAIVGGWTVVVKKGEYQPGDLAVYCEIDSWIPHALAPFLSKGQEPRTYEGVKGERLRTVKLRGQLSQGLLLPIDVTFFRDEGTDVSDALGIIKYEPPVPAQLAGQVRGIFPTAIPKTDQERVQNLVAEIAEYADRGLTFEVTEKLEGSSCTMYLDREDSFHVCSRNFDLQEDGNVSFWKVAAQYDVAAKMRARGLQGYALQGELVGEGVQGNVYKIKAQDFFVYDVYTNLKGRYLNALERAALCEDLQLSHVPPLDTAYVLSGNVDDLLKYAEGRSVLHDTEREGVVFKCNEDPSISFKAISNRYLLRHGG